MSVAPIYRGAHGRFLRAAGAGNEYRLATCPPPNHGRATGGVPGTTTAGDDNAPAATSFRSHKGRRDRVVVATKGGLWGHHRDPSREPVYDRAEKVVAAFEASLLRLETDYGDVYFDHIWWDKPEETDAFVRAFEVLKRDGKARAAGVSTDDLAYVKRFDGDGGIDAVQLEYSILNRKAERGILPYLEERGLGAVIGGPLQKGLLTGKFTPETRFPEGDVRHDWPNQPWYRESLSTVERLRALVRGDQTLGQLALRFALAHPAVSAAIPCAKTPEQVGATAAASRRPLLSEDELRLINNLAPGEEGGRCRQAVSPCRRRGRWSRSSPPPQPMGLTPRGTWTRGGYSDKGGTTREKRSHRGRATLAKTFGQASVWTEDGGGHL